MSETQLLNEEVVLAKRELRIVEGAARWRADIQPQPEFGDNLRDWMAAQKLKNTDLAKQVGCSPGTIGGWCTGSVPSPEFREKLVAAGYPGGFHYLVWSQDMFLASELVRMRNRKYVDGVDHPSREFYEKYLVKCRMPRVVAQGRGKARTIETLWEEKEFLFGTRVSDVVGIVGDNEVLMDWVAYQGITEAIGEPVLVGSALVEGVLSKVEIRGSYRKIEAWQNKCQQSAVVLDQNRARIRPWSYYSEGELLQFHREAFRNRYAKRDEAGMYGTRAHKLGQAWILYHALQERDQNGVPLIDAIMAPAHFWDSTTTSEVIVPVYLGNEPEEVQNALKALQFFYVSNQLVLVATEELLASLEHGVAGAVDCVCRDKNGKLVLLDWKTSNGVYPKMFNQVSWYCLLWFICHGEWPERAYIVRLDKLTAEVEVRCVYADEATREKRIQNALNVLTVYRGNEELESDLAAQEAEREKSFK